MFQEEYSECPIKVAIMTLMPKQAGAKPHTLDPMLQGLKLDSSAWRY
jgi:hypothetical protein